MTKNQDSASLSHRDGEAAEDVQRGEPLLTGIGGRVSGAVGGRREGAGTGRRWADLIAAGSEGSGGVSGGGGTLEERSSVGLLDLDDDGLHGYALGGWLTRKDWRHVYLEGSWKGKKRKGTIFHVFQNSSQSFKN